MAKIDMNRLSQGINLPPEVSSEIIGLTQTSSAVMQASKAIALPGTGASVPVMLGAPVPEWVGETEEIKADTPNVEIKEVTAYKLGVIVPFSREFVRDAGSLYDACVQMLPGALGFRFDQTVAGGVAVPGSNFDNLASAQAVEMSKNTAGDVDGVLEAVALADGDITAWVAAPGLRSRLIVAKDASGLPLFTNADASMYGAPVYRVQGVLDETNAVHGLAGDFANGAVAGTVENVQIKVSDQATVNVGGTAVNLFQRDMIAVRAVIEVGFRVADVDKFARITKPTP